MNSIWNCLDKFVQFIQCEDFTNYQIFLTTKMDLEVTSRSEIMSRSEIISRPQVIPLEKSCIGCKRYFILHEKLPLQSMIMEFKNYCFPVKESFLKQTLLKTIVGFLNSKGGTILMGINDSTGEVKGVKLGRKQMDEFKLMIKQMLQKVQPAVDLVKSEEVSIDFVPVLQGKKKDFYGKYVVKFVVLQGDPSKLYCVSQKIKVINNKIDEVEVISSFRRHNLGGVQQIKGIRVIHEIYQKARNPHKIAKTFHQDCNPQPLCPTLIEKPKQTKIPSIFEKSQEQVQRINSSKQVNIQLQKFQETQSIIKKINETDKSIINKITEVDKLISQDKKIKIEPQFQHALYFENLGINSTQKFINFLKNSTYAKSSGEISEQNGMVKVKFSLKNQKKSLLEQLSKPKFKKTMNGFGINNKINILSQSLLKKHPVVKTQPLITLQTKLQTQTENFTLIFFGYEPGYEKSIQNYLQKCITLSIQRKIKKISEGLEITFTSKREMFVFNNLATNSPHSKQLNQFWSGGKLKVKYNKTEQKSNQTNNQEKNFSSLQNGLKLEEKKINLSKPFELVASSLDPSSVPKFSNYLTNNMFYNIQKKIYASKDRYYIRIVFNSFEDCRKFMEFSQLEEHKSKLAIFSGCKTLRIGVPGQNLLIYPYTDTLKQELKKIVLKVLGQGSINKSAAKDLDGKQKIWSLSVADNSKLLECYQKLEAFFRKQGFYINQEWVRFKVFLQYKNFS